MFLSLKPVLSCVSLWGPGRQKRIIKQTSLPLFYKNKALRPTLLPHATSVYQTCAIRRFVDNQVPPLFCWQTLQTKFHCYRGVATIKLSTPLLDSKINETRFSSDTALSVSKVISCLWFWILLLVKISSPLFLNQSENKTRPAVTCSEVFPALGICCEFWLVNWTVRVWCD